MDPTRRRALPARSASITVISLFAITTNLAHAQNAEAMKRFQQAETLSEAGEVEKACSLFEESNRIESRAATLIYIGRCKEKLGKLASALAAFRDALVRVKDPIKKQIATKEAAALEQRVSRLTISVEGRVDRLAVSRDGQPIDATDYNRAIPVDGGSYEIAATIPGYQRWSTSIRVAPEGDQASVTVPTLVKEKRMKETLAPIKEDIQLTSPTRKDAGNQALKANIQRTPPTTSSAVRTVFKVVGYVLLGGGMISTAMFAVVGSIDPSSPWRGGYLGGFVGIPLGVVTLYFAYPSRS